jgi:hypothetical protein
VAGFSGSEEAEGAELIRAFMNAPESALVS